MIHTELIHCPYCNGVNLQKNGKTRNGTQRWACKECSKYFQLGYRYNACKHGVRDKILEMALNGSGVRDTGRVLKINKNTVVAVLKKNSKN
jgi:transposase-like protein